MAEGGLIMAEKAGAWRLVPGPKTREWLERYNAVSAKTTVSSSLVFERGEGVYLYDPDGNEYIDCGSPGTNFLGYGTLLRETFLPTIQGVFDTGLPRFATTDWISPYTTRAKELIRDAVPLSGPSRVMGTRAGGLAIEAAIKALRKARPEKKYFMSFWGAFHGRPHGALSLLDPHKKDRLEHYRLPYDTLRIRFPYRGYADPVALVDDEFARIRRTLRSVNGIFMELVQGEGGIRVIDPVGLRRIREWCRAYDIVLVADEIQTGMGRTGSRWSYEQYEFLPDIVTLGKALGGDVEDCNGLVIREDLSFARLSQEASTYDLPPLEAAVAAKALEALVEQQLPEKARTRGEYFGKLLKEAFSGEQFVKDVRGLGLMWGVEFTSTKLRDKMIQEAERYGLVLLSAGFPETEDQSLVSGPVIRWMPPLTISEEELKRAVEVGRNAYMSARGEILDMHFDY